jgi:uncharacterized membrane protein (DUF106 family)
MSEHQMAIRTWQEIAEEASHETDSTKLAELGKELERALEERDIKLRPEAMQPTRNDAPNE